MTPTDIFYIDFSFSTKHDNDGAKDFKTGKTMFSLVGKQIHNIHDKIFIVLKNNFSKFWFTSFASSKS